MRLVEIRKIQNKGFSPVLERAKAKRLFQEYLEGKGLKLTYERNRVFEEILSLRNHFDAESLYRKFQKKGVRISLDTIYRTLPLFLESGILQKSAGEGHRDFFERTSIKGHHDHMICVSCGTIIEFKCQEIEDWQDKVCDRHRFKLTFHEHKLFGYCKNCRD